MLFSKKNQKDFFKKILRDGFRLALEEIANWKRDLLLKDLKSLFKDFDN